MSARTITFYIAGVPAPAGSRKGFVNRKTGGVIMAPASKRSRPWQAAVSAAAAEAMSGELLAGPLELSVVFHMARPLGHFGTGRNRATVKPSAPAYPAVKPDATKLLRAVEDALTGVVWRDDAQVVDQHAHKRYAPTAGCLVIVSELVNALEAVEAA